MKTIINLTFFFVITSFQITFSQVQTSCDGINKNIVDSGSTSFLRMNDCPGDLVISIDESLLSANEDITLEGEILKNRQSIRIIGNQNHSIFIAPFYMDNTDYKKVVALNGKLPEERKTRVVSHNRDSKGEFELEGEIKVSPNPIDSDKYNEITIFAPKTELTIISYTLRNGYGVVILQEYFPDSNTIDVSNLNNGIYHIKIQTLQQAVTVKFIKN
jgi:hypothetical protein